MTLTVKDCLLKLSLKMFVTGLMLIMVSLEDHRAVELSLQMNQYIFHTMQIVLAVA